MAEKENQIQDEDEKVYKFPWQFLISKYPVAHLVFLHNEKRYFKRSESRFVIEHYSPSIVKM